MLRQREHQAAYPIPGNLNANAEQQEGDHPYDAMGSLRRYLSRDQWRISVGEVDEYAEHDDGDQNAEVSKQIGNESVSRRMGCQSQHNDDASGAGGDGEG